MHRPEGVSESEWLDYVRFEWAVYRERQARARALKLNPRKAIKEWNESREFREKHGLTLDRMEGYFQAFAKKHGLT